MDAIYTKTPAGRQELAERTRKLPARLRRLLVMVDGRKSAQALISELAATGLTDESLNELLLAGLIELNTVEPPPAETPNEKHAELSHDDSPEKEEEPTSTFLPKWPPD